MRLASRSNKYSFTQSLHDFARIELMSHNFEMDIYPGYFSLGNFNFNCQRKVENDQLTVDVS